MPRTLPDNLKKLSDVAKGEEEKARAMFLAGIDWLEANAEKKPRLAGMTESATQLDLIKEDNVDGQELRAVVAKAGAGTPARQQSMIAVMCVAVMRMGWDTFIERYTPPAAPAKNPE